MSAMVLVLGWACASCGLIAMPFRVAGSVAKHSYQAGKRVVNKASKPKETTPTDPKTKPADAAATAKGKEGKDGPQDPQPQPPAAGNSPEPPANPNVPVPPADLPTQPGDMLPPLPEELPPL